MGIIKIPDDDGNGFTFAFGSDDVINVDPLSYFREKNIEKNMVLYREMLRFKVPFIANALSQEFFRGKAEESWAELLDTILAADVPQNFESLLNSTSKGEQERLLKNQSITAMGLGAFLIKAGSNHGYSMSKYRTEHLAKNTEREKLPKLIYLQNDGRVKKVGYTPLTDGQLRNVITQRKVIIAHILDRQDNWHCFFQTEKSMKGEEKWRGGQPHLHYLSDKWGVSRENTIQRIIDGDYPATSVHIALND